MLDIVNHAVAGLVAQPFRKQDIHQPLCQSMSTESPAITKSPAGAMTRRHSRSALHGNIPTKLGDAQLRKRSKADAVEALKGWCPRTFDGWGRTSAQRSR
jgi:hypothetical protein